MSKHKRLAGFSISELGLTCVDGQEGWPTWQKGQAGSVLNRAGTVGMICSHLAPAPRAARREEAGNPGILTKALPRPAALPCARQGLKGQAEAEASLWEAGKRKAEAPSWLGSGAAGAAGACARNGFKKSAKGKGTGKGKSKATGGRDVKALALQAVCLPDPGKLVT